MMNISDGGWESPMAEAFDVIVRELSVRPDIERITGPQAARMVLEWPEIPAEYVDFLVQAGFGHLGDLQFYDGPVPIGDIYTQHKPTKTIVLIRDDFQGYCFGFDLGAASAFVEVSPKGAVSYTSHRSFTDFVISCFGDLTL